MFWAESTGLDKIVARMDDFRAEHGEHWEAAGLLRRLAEEKRGFSNP
jgi:3-hydroxyacyl-CoA dehydrogenase